ncbi:TraM recognition domain-containing protein [Tsukamurella sp. USMM236]|uniref:TraM recognition domain-containing protein n=1 Tax=Tsukamurella sp. USMM236 TaxID=3081301 RepID=UPI00301AB19A
MALYRKDSGPFKPQQTPFGGFIDGRPARTGPHCLVTGLTGLGKSRRVLGPGLLMWDGPAVAISSKPDLIDLCLERRLEWGGHDKTYVLDMSGQVPDDVLPPGVIRVYADPVALIANDDDALDIAGELFKSGTAGQSGGGKDSGGDSFWESATIAVLAGVLRAAGEDGVRWARSAVGRIQPPTEEDTETPCWINAIDRLERMGSDDLADEIEEAMTGEEKFRDSVRITAKTGLVPWLRTTVRGRPGEVPFLPEMLEEGCATLFMVAPADGVAAGAAVATVDAISNHWRRGQTRKIPLPQLLVVADELCNTLPWSKLPTVVTESRAMGLALLVAVQSTTQFARRYGEAGMVELRAVFPSILCLAGTGTTEPEILKAAAWAHGQSEWQKITVDHKGNQSQTSERVDTMHGAELIPDSIDHGRLLRGSHPDSTGPALSEAGLLVDLFDISTIPFKTATATSTPAAA